MVFAMDEVVQFGAPAPDPVHEIAPPAPPGPRRGTDLENLVNPQDIPSEVGLCLPVGRR
jgi:hypothetical protein